MTPIYNNEVNNIYGCNLLHDIINPPKRAKNVNNHYSPILHRCMNNRKGKARLKTFRVLLESGYSSTIVIGSIVKQISLEEDALMQWNTQPRNVTTNLKVKVYFTLPAFSATNFMTFNFHVDEFSKGGYDMILGQDILT